MIALVVAETQSALSALTLVLNEAGCAVIARRWHESVLDDVAARDPDITIVSAGDYPRRWDALIGRIGTLPARKGADVLLYVPADFPPDERKKAEAANIACCFSDADSFQKLKDYIARRAKKPSQNERGTGGAFVPLADGEPLLGGGQARTVEAGRDAEDFAQAAEEITTTEAKPVPQSETFVLIPGERPTRNAVFIDESEDDEESEDEDMPEISWKQHAAQTPPGEEIMSLTENQPKEGRRQTIPSSFVLTNPVTLAMVSGISRNFDGETLEFTPDLPSFILNLSKGTRIEDATLKSNEKIEAVRAVVISNDGKKLVLKITKK